MNYLFIGGGGLIGTYAIRELLKEGHRVISYDLDIRDNAIHRVLTNDEFCQVKLISGDVMDLVGILEIVRANKIDMIVNLAAALIPQGQAHPALATKINVDGLNNVFEVAKACQVKRVVWASSIAVFGPQSIYSEEPGDDTFHAPVTVYGACKSFNEFMGHHYFKQFGLDNIGLRFTVVYGPHRMRGALAYDLGVELLENPGNSKPARVPMGDTLINWQYVEDAASSVVLSLKHEGPTQTRVFNTGGDVLKVRDAADVVRKILPEAEIEVEDGDASSGLGGIYQLSIEGARRELGYDPKYTFETGARKSIDRYRELQGLQPI